ncbi:MAG TPA: DUF4082 domain-containing protein [Candidatus Saccharimonadales bacterium]|nr:DUF4082 domain-containing protein [Candidatus Saccharimonadales bacterium]
MPHTIFTNQVPAIPDVDEDAPNQTLGTTWYTEDDGAVNAIRFYLGSRNYDGAEMTGGLYNADTQELLGQGSYTITASDDIGFVEIPLSNAVVVERNQKYIAAVLFPGQASSPDARVHYAATGGFFLANGVDNSPLHAYKDNGLFLTERNGLFVNGTTLTFPTSTFGGGCYFVDVVFDYTTQVKLRTSGSWTTYPLKTRVGGNWQL